VLAESVLMPFLGAAMSGAADVPAGGRSGRVRHRRAGHPEIDVAAIHARWQAQERATLAAVDRKLGIDNESDT
jgi:hypothetical protein